MSDEPKVPVEIIRDLLAIAKALYAARRAEGARAGELGQLEAASRALTASLSMSDHAAHTVGGRAAWSWAEQGLALLGDALCREGASARVFVSAWRRRLRER